MNWIVRVAGLVSFFIVFWMTIGSMEKLTDPSEIAYASILMLIYAVGFIRIAIDYFIRMVIEFDEYDSAQQKEKNS